MEQFDCFLDPEMIPDLIYVYCSADKPDKGFQSRSHPLSIAVEYGLFQSGWQLKLLRFDNKHNGF